MTGPTRAERVRKLTAVAWYLERHPAEFGAIEALAHLEMTAEGVRLYDEGGIDRCVSCGKLSVVRGYTPAGEPVCQRCEP